MKLDLVNGRNCLRFAKQLGQMSNGEIADANGTRFASFAEHFQHMPALNALPHGIMNQIKIHIVHFELTQTRLERSLRVAMIGIPQFGRDKNLLTGNTAFVYRGADALFIAVHRSRIDVPVPCFERCQDRSFTSDARTSLPHTQSKLRNLPAIVQGNFAFDRQARLHGSRNLSWSCADAPAPVN